MAYTKQDWRRLKSELIPVEPENLEHIEEGIVDLEAKVQAGLGEIETTTTTTVADYLIEKPTEDFKVIEKIPLKEGTVYEVVVTIDGVESSYSAQLVNGDSIDLASYNLTGFKVLTCGDLSGADTKGLLIIQDCIASLSPQNTASITGYTSIYSSYDKVVIKDAYVNTKTAHKIKNQDAKYAEAFQADVLCTDEKDISFIKNNPIQKELVKNNKGYEIAFNATNLDFEIPSEDSSMRMGYVKDTVANSKIDFDAETLTLTFVDPETGTETFELSAVSGETVGWPKAATLYINENFINSTPVIIRGLTKITAVDGNFNNLEYTGAVDADGLPLYDANGEMVADNNALFILAFDYLEILCKMYGLAATINETISEEVEHLTVTEQFAKDFQADFAEGDDTKIGFIKNMPFYATYKSLSGFTITELIAAGEDFKLLTGTTKNSLLLDKDSNYKITLFDTLSDDTIAEIYNIYPGIVYNRTEMLEAMRAENFLIAIPESEIAALESVLPADSAMLAVDVDGFIIPLIFTHIHMSIAEDRSLQVVTEENTEENYFTYVSILGTESANTMNITGKNIPENNYKFKTIKKLPSEFLDINTTSTVDRNDYERPVSGSAIWNFMSSDVQSQVLSTSDGHINFVKTTDSQNQKINFSAGTVGIGYNNDLQTTDKDTIVGAINEVVNDIDDVIDIINEHKLQVADSGVNNVYYTDKNEKLQEELLKQNYVTAVDKHTCYEALLNDTNIYWCPPYKGENYIYGFSTETFTVYRLDMSTKKVTKTAEVKDAEIKTTLKQAFASSDIICVDLNVISGYEVWVYKSPTSSQYDQRDIVNLASTYYLKVYTRNKKCTSIGFSGGVIRSANVTTLEGASINFPTTLKNTGNSLFSTNKSQGSTRTETQTGRKWTITTYYTDSYRKNILTQDQTAGINYVLSGSSIYGDTTYSNLQLVIATNGEQKAQRALNSEGVEIYSYEGTDYTGIDNNTHSTYIYLRTIPGEGVSCPFCLTSAGEAIWRSEGTGSIQARKTIQTNSSDLFTAATLGAAKLYYCTENQLLYVVNGTSIYAINIYDENPTATVIKATSTDDFTFDDNCYLIGFGENFVLLTNGSTLKVVQIRESFNYNELKLGDTAQDKIVLKDAETGDLYNLVIKSGQVVIEAVTV